MVICYVQSSVKSQLDPVGFPIHALTDGVAGSGAPISPSLHRRVRTHLIGQRTSESIWPSHSSNLGAVDAYRLGHAALYETSDPVAASRFYLSATELDANYLHAWVGLALSWTSIGTLDSLDSAVQVWSALCDGAGDQADFSETCVSILWQNFAYTLLQQYLHTDDVTLLEKSEVCYDRAHAVTGLPRPELHYPWCHVLLRLGLNEKAENIWKTCHLGDLGSTKHVYLSKYTDLVVADLRWSK